MNKNKPITIPNQQKFTPQKRELPVANSLLDVMHDNREFESLIHYRIQIPNMLHEVRRGIQEIANATGRYTMCYLANQVNQNIKANVSINPTDDLPFREMVNVVASNIKEVDIILVTPGGSGEQVAKIVDYLRPRFTNVRFIIPSSTMSAGTILIMSGDEIIMTPTSYIGPTDPQVPNRDGRFVPAQSTLSLIEDIRQRGNEALKIGQQPNWVDLQILNRIDPKDIGSALNGSKYSIELVKDFLIKYKFALWNTHKTSGNAVTVNEKTQAALEIATKFCDHNIWKSHSRGITREIAWNECRLQITNSETIAGLDRAIRRFWAMMNWIFENTPVFKVFVSPDYSVFRQDINIVNQPKT